MQSKTESDQFRTYISAQKHSHPFSVKCCKNCNFCIPSNGHKEEKNLLFVIWPPLIHFWSVFSFALDHIPQICWVGRVTRQGTARCLSPQMCSPWHTTTSSLSWFGTCSCRRRSVPLDWCLYLRTKQGACLKCCWFFTLGGWPNLLFWLPSPFGTFFLSLWISRFRWWLGIINLWSLFLFRLFFKLPLLLQNDERIKIGNRSP